MTELQSTENPSQAGGKPRKLLTSRLQKSKNFWKTDRNRDDYLEQNKLLNGSEKRLLRKLLNLRKKDDDNEVKVTVAGLSKLLAVAENTARAALRGLWAKGFLIYQRDVVEDGCNFPRKVFAFPETFPGFDAKQVFIRRGDKQKARIRKEQQAQRSTVERQQKVTVKVGSK